jgi:PAS domain S-box-containing protein
MLGKVLSYEGLSRASFLAKYHGKTKEALESLKRNLHETIRMSNRNHNGFALSFIALNFEGNEEITKKLQNQFFTFLKEHIFYKDHVIQMTPEIYAVVIKGVKVALDLNPIFRDFFRALNTFKAEYPEEIAFSTSSGVSLYPLDGREDRSLILSAAVALKQSFKHSESSINFENNKVNPFRSFDFIKVKNPVVHEIFQKRRDMIDRVEDATLGINPETKLVLTFQPVVGDNEISAEVLLRLQVAGRKELISPQEFIPIAIETGQIKKIDVSVLNETCLQIKKWKMLGINLSLAIDISAEHFDQIDLPQKIKRIIDLHGIEPSLIKIEITETQAVQDIYKTKIILNELKKMGIAIWLDDFGTGYSSWSLLHDLPIDGIKIDRKFISNMNFKNTQLLVKNLINTAIDLGLKTVTEGVETEEQARLLKKWGCDYLQGYFFSKPLPADEFAQWLQKRPFQMTAPEKPSISNPVISELSLYELKNDLDKKINDLNNYFLLTDDMFCITNKDGKYRFMNPGFRKTLGYSEEDPIDWSVDFFMHPEDMKLVKEKINRRNAGEINVSNTEARMRCKDGSYKIISWVAVFKNGEIYAIGRDVTLEREKQKRMEIETKSKNEYLSHKTHDIRNLLQQVMGIIEMQTDGEHLSKEDLEMVKISGQGLINSLNSLLRMLKIEEREWILKKEPFVLQNLMTEILDLHGTQAKNRNLKLTLAYHGLDSKLPLTVIGDQIKLKQILVNLIGNAFEFTRTGEIKLKLSVQERTTKKIKIRFSIIDTGCGVPANKQNLIFEPYGQVKGIEAENRKIGGSGLGLNIVKKLAELMGTSELGVISPLNPHSQNEKGSEFWVNLDFEIGEITVEEPLSIPLARAPIAYEKIRTLIVDDQEPIRRLIKTLMKGYGMTDVHLAENAEAGLELARSNQYHLLVVDKNMPGMSGTEMTKIIRQLPSYEKIKVISISGEMQDADLTEKDIKVNAVLNKPFSSEKLRDMIDDFFGAMPS